jgi:hypothetical protein
MRQRKRVRDCFLVGFLLLAVGYAAAQQLTEFSSEEGRYSILMPGKPTKGTFSLQTATSTVTAHTVTAISPSIDLMCGYYDFPSPEQNVEKVFDATRDGSITKVHGTLLAEKKITLDGYSGRRFRSTGIGNAFLDEEIFMVGRRFYLITITTATKEPNTNIGKILDSFHFRPQDQ